MIPIETLVEMRQSGMTLNEIAGELGLHRNTIDRRFAQIGCRVRRTPLAAAAFAVVEAQRAVDLHAGTLKRAQARLVSAQARERRLVAMGVGKGNGR